MYVRKINNGKRDYYQLAHDYREGKKKRVGIIAHLGTIPDPETAREYWTEEVALLRRTGQHGKADKLERKLIRLRDALEEDKAKKAEKQAKP